MNLKSEYFLFANKNDSFWVLKNIYFLCFFWWQIPNCWLCATCCNVHSSYWSYCCNYHRTVEYITTDVTNYLKKSKNVVFLIIIYCFVLIFVFVVFQPYFSVICFLIHVSLHFSIIIELVIIILSLCLSVINFFKGETVLNPQPRAVQVTYIALEGARHYHEWH